MNNCVSINCSFSPPQQIILIFQCQCIPLPWALSSLLIHGLSDFSWISRICCEVKVLSDWAEIPVSSLLWTILSLHSALALIAELTLLGSRMLLSALVQVFGKPLPAFQFFLQHMHSASSQYFPYSTHSYLNLALSLNNSLLLDFHFLALKWLNSY